MPASSKEFLYIKAFTESGFTWKRVHEMIGKTIKFTGQITTHNIAESFGQFS